MRAVGQLWQNGTAKSWSFQFAAVVIVFRCGIHANARHTEAHGAASIKNLAHGTPNGSDFDMMWERRGANVFQAGP